MRHMPMPSEAPPRPMSSVKAARGSIQAPVPVREPSALWRRVIPFLGIAVLLLSWDLGVRLSGSSILPGPIATVGGLIEMLRKGLLLRYAVASLFRVTWGYALAVCLAIPF